VASQDDASASVLDAADGAVVATVDFAAMGYGAAARPHHVAVEPDGSFWYVSLIGAGRVLKLDARNQVVAEASFEAPGMLALDAEGDRLYVGRSMAAVNPPPRIGMLDRESMAVTEIDVLFQRPHALVVGPDGERIFTASLAENRLAFAPVGSEAVDLLPIEGPHHMVVQLAMSPDGRWMVGTGQMSGQLLVWEFSGRPAPSHAHTLDLGGQPWHPTFTPDGAEVWVPRLEANAVGVVETSTWRVAATITHPALVEPHGSAASADGRTVFVSSRNTAGTYGSGAPGTVVAIDVATRAVRWVTEVGPYAAGLAVR
jgi:DNA-binding beta-propeller fold protein YncE